MEIELFCHVQERFGYTRRKEVVSQLQKLANKTSIQFGESGCGYLIDTKDIVLTNNLGFFEIADFNEIIKKRKLASGQINFRIHGVEYGKCQGRVLHSFGNWARKQSPRISLSIPFNTNYAMYPFDKPKYIFTARELFFYNPEDATKLTGYCIRESDDFEIFEEGLQLTYNQNYEEIKKEEYPHEDSFLTQTLEEEMCGLD